MFPLTFGRSRRQSNSEGWKFELRSCAKPRRGQNTNFNSKPKKAIVNKIKIIKIGTTEKVTVITSIITIINLIRITTITTIANKIRATTIIASKTKIIIKMTSTAETIKTITTIVTIITISIDPIEIIYRNLNGSNQTNIVKIIIIISKVQHEWTQIVQYEHRKPFTDN